jgi:hypothetical protein
LSSQGSIAAQLIVQMSTKAPYGLALLVCLLLGLLPAATAEVALAPRLVIIDTGIDSSMPIFTNHLVHEVCIMDWYTCPNGTNFQEGPGTATVPDSIINFNGFDHGTQMAAIAMGENPNLEFIFIRIHGNNRNGARLNVSENTVMNALDWAKLNAKKYNIKAISMSQGHHVLKSGSKYCPSTKTFEKKILDLKYLDIPVFLPTGNAGDKNRIDWPACIVSAIAVGALNEKDQITSYSNMDRTLTDFYVLGDIATVGPAGAYRFATGTSVSTQIAAAKWIAMVSAYPTKSYIEIYSAFRTSGAIVFDKSYRFGRKMELDKALALFVPLVP